MVEQGPKRYTGARDRRAGDQSYDSSGTNAKALAAAPRNPAAPTRRYVRQQVCTLDWHLVGGAKLTYTPHVACLQVPDSILHNGSLNDAIAVLPANYSFEVGCLWTGPSRHAV